MDKASPHDQDAELATLGFRRLETGDLPLMLAWLTTPFVSRWYPLSGNEAVTADAVARKYQPYIRGERPTHPYLILRGGEPVGYIQWYLIDDWRAYAARVGAPQGAAGVDLFIGGPELAYRGLGSSALVLFLRRVVFAQSGVSCCVVGPSPDNKAAIRAYEKAGFRAWKTISGDSLDGAEFLMKIDRVEDAAMPGLA
jgi:RimJ/RimL family protein N-acetyltransferase